LVTTEGIQVQDDASMKAMLHRIVATLTRMAMKCDGVAGPCAAYNAAIDCDNELRCAEHEHESQTVETPEQRNSAEPPAGSSFMENHTRRPR
jgi:hypothetical protein